MIDTEQTVLALASDAVVEFDNDTDRAAKHFLSTFRTVQPEMYQEQCERAMLQWSITQVHQARSRMRQGIVAYANASSTAQVQRQEGLGKSSLEITARQWLLWPMADSGGLFLKDATRPDVLAASERYLTRSKTEQARGNWMKAIAAAMPNDTVKVEKALGELKVAKLAEKFHVSK